MARFAVPWRIKFWEPSGRVAHEAGEELVEAATIETARRDVERRLAARFAPPFELQIDGGHWTRTRAPSPAGVPDAGTLRDRVRAGLAPDVLFRELAAAVTPLAAMVAFEEAFGLSLDELAGDVAARVREMQYRWDRPHRLRVAHARGDSIVDLLHAEHARDGSLQLFVSLREAFDLAFADAKELLELACRRDPRFDEALAAAIGRGPAQGWR
jgi:hypothetical protein